MSPGDWAWVGAFGAAVVFVAVGWLAFWPEDPTAARLPLLGHGRHRRREAQRVLDEAEGDRLLQDIQPPEDWTPTASRPPARHRHEHLAEGTQRLVWPPEAEDAPDPG